MRKNTPFFLLFFLFLFSMMEATSSPVVVPLPTEEAIRYYHSGNVLWVVELIWALLIPLCLVFSGGAAKLRDIAQRIGKGRIRTLFIFTFFFLGVLTLSNLPLAYYAHYVRPHIFSLSNETFKEWINHFLLSFAIGNLASFILIFLLNFVIRTSPKRWWLICAFLFIPFAFFIEIAKPLWVDPLYDNFRPMSHQVLEEKILTLAQRAGIEGSHIYEVEKSDNTRMMNAYVIGAFNVKRIVLWDTIIKGLNEEELLFVVGHEMGHYVLNHVLWGIVVSFVIGFIILFCVYHVGNILMRRFFHRFKFNEFSDIASLPLLFFLYLLFATLLTPAWNTYSQKIEREADRFGLELTHSNHAAATGFIKLLHTNLGYPFPGKFYMLFRATHPSIGERVEFFNTYHPWLEGKEEKYKKHFKNPCWDD